MSVYVDKMMVCLRNKNWPYSQACHLVADSVQELHIFAWKIGLHKSWFRDKPELPHYDLTYGMRNRAVFFGAIEVDSKKIVEMMKKNRSRRAGP